MADIQKTIEIVFGATDKTAGALSSVAGGIDSFTNSVSGVTAPLASLGDSLVTAEAGIVAMGAAMLAVATNEAAKFQASVNEIGTLFGATSEQTAAFGRQIQDYALGSTQSIDSINKATYAAISAGVDYSKSLEFVNAAEKLSVAGRADLSDTTVLLISTLNAYGASTDEAAKYSDALFQTVKLGQTTIPELSSSLAQVTGVAAAAGIPFDTLAAAIAALTAAGLPTSQAITGIKAAISNIIQPSSEAEKAAAALGIQFDAAALKTKGFEGVLKDAYVATGGNVTQMGALFGSVEGLNSALILGSDKAGKFAADLQGMADKAGSTQAAFDLMAGNFDASMQRMQNALVVTLQTAGTPLLEQFGGVVTSLADVFKAVKFSIDQGAFQPIYDALAIATEGLTKYLQGIAAALPEALGRVDFTNLIGAFGGLGESITGLFGGLDLTKPDDLAKALQFVADSVATLTKLVSGMVETFGPAISGLLSMAEAANNSDGSFLNVAGNVLGASKQFELFKGVLEVSANTIILAAGSLNVLGTAGKAVGAFLEEGLLYRLGQFIGLIGQAGLVAAAGAGGYALGTVLNEGISRVLSAVTGSETTLGGFIFELTHSGEAAETMGAKTKAAATGVDAITTAAEKATEEQKALQAALEAAGVGAGKFAEQSVKVTTATGEQGQVVFKTQEELDAYLQKLDAGWAAQEKLGQVTAATNDSTEKFVKTINADGTVTYTQNLTAAATGATNLATATDKAKAATDAAAKAQEEWNKKLQEMQFQERMEAIKSATEVTVAAITAESSKAVAAFDSIATSIQSTDDSITKLFTTDAPDWDSFGFSIKEAAEAQLEIKKALADAQIKLLEEQIKSMEIRNDLMRQGMPQIVIQADGLEPHITAFMFEILNKIQVRASQLGAEWLVGGGMVGV